MRIPALTVAAALASTNRGGGSASGEQPSNSGNSIVGIGPVLGVSAFVVPPSGAAAVRRSRSRPVSSQIRRGISSTEQYLQSLSINTSAGSATGAVSMSAAGPLQMSTAAPPESLVSLPEMDKDGLYCIENAEQHQ